MEDKNSSSSPQTYNTPPRIIGYIEGLLEDHQTSLLTNSLREYLLGRDEFEGENADQKENQKRMRLRNRVKEGIMDFMLVNQMSDRDRYLIFQDLDENDRLYNGIVEMISFIYLGLRDTPIKFELMVQEGVFSAESKVPSNQEKEIEEVDVEIDKTYREKTDVDEIRRKAEKGKPISKGEFLKLFSDEEVDQVEVTNGEFYLDTSVLAFLAQNEADDISENED